MTLRGVFVQLFRISGSNQDGEISSKYFILVTFCDVQIPYYFDISGHQLPSVRAGMRCA